VPHGQSQTDIGRHIERSRSVTIKSVSLKSIAIQLKLFIQ